MKKFHPATILLAICLLASGASGLITQYIVTGISSQLLGNTLKQVAVVVGLMMLGYGLAGILQKNIETKLIGWFVFLECVLASVSGTTPVIMQWSYINLPEQFEYIQYFVSLFIGLLVGLEIPLVMRINERYVKSLDVNLATTFSWDYIGAAGGSLLFIWLLMSTGLSEIAIIASSINFAIAASTFFYFTKVSNTSGKGMIPGSIAVFLTAFILSYTAYSHKTWQQAMLANLYDDTVVFSKKTQFQHLVITHNDLNDDWRLFINGNLQFSSVDEYIYHENLIHPAAHFLDTQDIKIKSALILGGGDGLAAKELWKYPSMKDITLVDLDPDMTKVARAELNKVNEGALERVNIIHDDAYEFVKKNSGDWDLIIIDFPDPNHVVLNKLYSYEFYANLRKATKPNAMIVIQSTSPMHAKETFLCIQRTTQAAGWNILPYHDNVPTFGDWGWVMGWKRDWTPDYVVKSIATSGNYKVQTKHTYPRQFLASTVFPKSILSKESSVNTNNNPYIVTYYVKESEFWD